jgi:hypothetical protein
MIPKIITQKLPYYEHQSANKVLMEVMAGRSPTRPEKKASSCDPLEEAVDELMDICWRSKPEDRPTCRKIVQILEGKGLVGRSAGGRQGGSHYLPLASSSNKTEFDPIRVEQILIQVQSNQL